MGNAVNPVHHAAHGISSSSGCLLDRPYWIDGKLAECGDPLATGQRSQWLVAAGNREEPALFTRPAGFDGSPILASWRLLRYS